MKYFYPLFICLFLSVNFLHAQKRADSLAKILANYPKRDTQYVNLLNRTAFAYYNSTPKKTLKLGTEALTLSQKLKFEKGIARSYNTLGVFHLVTSNYPKAITYYKKSLRIYLKVKDFRLVANLHFNLGVVAAHQAKYDIAIDYYLQATKYFQNINDTQAMASCYNNLGVAYKKRKEYKDATNYYKLSLDGYKKIKFQPGIASAYTNLGRISQVMRKYDKSLEYYQKALNISIKIGNKRTQSVCYHNIGEIKATLNQHQEAIKYYEKSNILEKELGNLNGQAISYNFLAESYRVLKKYEQASENLLQARLLAQKSGSKDVLKNNYLFQAKLDSTLSKYLKALANFQKYTLLKDSLFNKKKSEQIAQMKTRFETEQKESKILLLEKDKVNQQNTIDKQYLAIALIGLGLLSTIVIAIILYKYYSTKKSANLTLQSQKNKIEETHEQLKKAHTSVQDSIQYAERIQRAILPMEDKMKVDLPHHFVFYKPRDIVSGDFYWFEEAAGKYFLVAADCTGHGVPGAFMTMLGSQLLTNIIIQKDVHCPDEILNNLDMMLPLALHSKKTLVKDGMDIVVCVIDKYQQKLQYAGAQNPLVMVQQDKLEVIKGDIYSINGHRRDESIISYTLHTIDLTKYDEEPVFYIYSDGIQDQFGGEKNKKFSRKRLRNLLLDIHTKPIPEQLEIVNKTINNWQKDYEQIDDMLLIGFRVS